jgi:hypothetical protein
MAKQDDNFVLPDLSDLVDQSATPLDEAAPKQRNLVVAEPTFNPEQVESQFFDETARGLGTGFVDMASLGFSDELSAALQTGAISGEDYERLVAQERAKMEEARQKAPIASGIGSALGIAATAALPTKFAAPFTGAAKGSGIVSRILAGSADAALMGGAAQAGFTEGDKLEGLKEGAQMGAAIGVPIAGLAQGLPALTKAISKAPYIQRGQKAYEKTMQTGLVPGSGEDLSQLRKLVQSTEQDVAQTLKKGVTERLEPLAKKQIEELGELAVQTQKAGLKKSGQEIEGFINQILDEGRPVDIKALVTKSLDDIETGIAAGVLEEAKIKGLRDQLSRLKEVAPPPAVTKTLQTTDATDLLTGEALPQTQKFKIAGKEVTAEELTKLAQQLPIEEPVGAARAQAQRGALRTDTVTETAKLSAPPSLRETVLPQELVQTRNLLKKMLESPDPAMRRTARTTYGELTSKLFGELPTEEAIAKSKEARQTYQKALELGEEVTERSFAGQPTVSPKFLDTLEKTPDSLSTSESKEIRRIFQLLEELDPTLKNQNILGQAQSAAQNLQEAQQITKTYLQGKLGEDARTSLFPGIRKGVVGYEQNIADAGGEAGEALRGALRKAAPEEMPRLEPKLKNVSERLELANVAADDVGILEFSPRAAAFGTVRQVPVKVGGYAALGSKAIDRAQQATIKSVAKGTNLAGKLSGMSDDQWTQFVQNLSAKGKKGLASLFSASLGKDRIARNAAIFMASQNKGLRDELDSLNDDMTFKEPDLSDLETDEIEE